MSSSDYPQPSSQEIVVLGCGGLAADLLAEVASFPNPDDKIRTTSLKIQGGGNAGNALTCVARLGLRARLISKIANDGQGKQMLEELEADGVDTSFLVVAEEGNSPFTYVIVDSQTKTRTCIHTPGYPPMVPQDLSEDALKASMEGVRVAYFDARLPQTAIKVAREVQRLNIPILVDAERRREGLDDLLHLATYLVCSAKFPQEYTRAPSVPHALVSLLLKLPNLEFVIVTLGEKGCLMIQKIADDSPTEEVDVGTMVNSLKDEEVDSWGKPTCITARVANLRADGIGTVKGRVYAGTAEKIPAVELVDTTGAGDAFIGAVLYGICKGMTPEKMVPFASQVAAACCRDLGARSGLPYISDPLLKPFV